MPARYLYISTSPNASYIHCRTLWLVIADIVIKSHMLHTCMCLCCSQGNPASSPRSQSSERRRAFPLLRASATEPIPFLQRESNSTPHTAVAPCSVGPQAAWLASCLATRGPENPAHASAARARNCCDIICVIRDAFSASPPIRVFSPAPSFDSMAPIPILDRRRGKPRAPALATVSHPNPPDYAPPLTALALASSRPVRGASGVLMGGRKERGRAGRHTRS